MIQRLGYFFLGLQSDELNTKNWLNKVDLKREYDSLIVIKIPSELALPFGIRKNKNACHLCIFTLNWKPLLN